MARPDDFPDQAPDYTEAPRFLPGDEAARPGHAGSDRPAGPAEGPETGQEQSGSAPASGSRLLSPALIIGALAVTLVLIGGFLAIRVFYVNPREAQSQSQPQDGPMPDEPRITLPPRSGTPAPVQKVAVGDRVRIEGIYGSGSLLITEAEWSDRGDLPPSQGRRYLNVNVRYDGAEGSLFTSPNYFSAYDAQQTEYVVGIGSGKPSIGDHEVKAGQSVSGWASIEMPPGPVTFVVSDEGINPLVLVDIPAP